MYYIYIWEPLDRQHGPYAQIYQRNLLRPDFPIIGAGITSAMKHF